ncbi:Uncharacterized conserved protein, DUF305 family [Haloechinothrix alba]|uniref:Uncharacterized conserved protein, DUF305 family n=1 Tax=Haloechinothrix alba TaxID=664784 RepID=A0A238Z189_9PSEU|nr:DUF305 domain-containing protein [Haloechinothrix alba]SNR77106.1 Uncharacterized conserved protein, DUF305 family [Haloechinothrix alba]
MTGEVPPAEREPGNSPEARGGAGASAARGGGTATWARVVIVSGAALALLLVGATAGLLLGRAELLSEPRTPEPGAVDVGFAQDMSVHHQQAVTMGNWVRDHSTDPRVRQLGFDIASAQLGEVGMMEGWLTLWDEPLAAPGAYMTWMGDGEHGHGHGQASSGGDDETEAPMPGMATNDELARMRSLSGTELDVYFLQLMHRHHLGGVDMAEYAVNNARVPAVRRLAQSMLDVQGAEVEIMENMLADRDAEPLPFPTPE